MEQTATENVYSQRYVAFIDILGFSGHVRQSEHAPLRPKSWWLATIWNKTVESESGCNQWIVFPAQRDFEK